MSIEFTEPFSPSPLLNFTIAQNRSSGGHGTTLWDGARVLSRFLARTLSKLEGKKVIELGAGAASLGCMVCSKLGAQVVVSTDLPEILELARANVEANGIPAVVSPLDWTWTEIPNEIMQHAPYDIVLASDTLFSVALVEPFLDKIMKLAHAKSVIYVAFEERDPIVVKKFEESAKEMGFELSRQKAAKFRTEDEAEVVIAKLKLKRTGSS